MPSRLHWSTGKNNRSQHNLVGSTAAEDSPSGSASAGGANPPSGAVGATGAANNQQQNPPSSDSPNTAFSSSESFQHDTSAGRPNHQQQQQQQGAPPPPPHLINIYGNAAGGPNSSNLPPQLQHSNSVTGGAFDSRQAQQREQDYADQVTRSQSQRYPQISPISTQLHQQHQQQQQHHQHQQQQQQQQQQHSHRHPQHPSLGSGSVEDLSATGGQSISSPISGPPQPLFNHQQQQQQQQQPPPPQPPKKQSTRKLIKNILRGQDYPPQVPQNPYNNSPPAINRRNSKRVSLPAPPSIRTGPSQISQLSLDQQQLDWQNQAPPTQPSPLQGVGDFRESYIIDGSDQGLQLQNQNPHDIQQHPTIRPVPPSDSGSPYSADDVAYRQHQGHLQQQHQHQGQGSHEVQQHQQQQYGQAIFEPSPHQQQLSPPSQHQQQQQPQQSPQQQQQQYQQYPNQQQYQGGFNGHLGNPQQQNPETISQLSHESPIVDSDQRSVTSNLQLQGQSSQNSSAVSYSHQAQDIPGHSNPLLAAQAQTPQQQSMAPPTGGPPPARRSQDTEKGLRDPAQAPPGPPPSYRQSQQPNNMNPLPQPPNAAGAPPNFRSSNVPDRQQFDGPGDMQGRNSPQPPPSDRGGEDPDKAFKDLLVKYKNVKRLYFDGKKEIEQLNGQVEQLQNAIANQRMSQSRTSLDDNEYSTRFNRLNGAINNLSFNIRKDWVTLPQWLVPFVSADALKTGKQEMTAVGRAVITRWLVDEIFNRCFHPGLEPELSRQLKMIEQNIRHFSYTLNSQEEWDALTSKVVSWRMATLEGLQDVLRSAESANHKNEFTRRATSNLTASLFQHLADPPPAGVDGSASMIVELAVGIASNLPMESRDVAITYPLPESPVQPDIMEIEKTGLPALEARPAEGADDGAGEESGKDGGKDGKGRHEKARGALLSALGAGSNNPGSRKGSVVDASQTIPPPPKDAGKVRFAGFVAVEVRGRQVLVKAPVWTLG
ncbi:hypothetical protein QBC35DRAFT_378136 [Podospora australis]|uniref:S-adenosylmethionine-dependent methyltransferase-like protein n=1 Tax=Podospora australis TaxID=1536484 RepID=A0AAN7AKV9_9PEZI|nr:hypothetical protein QBC35DRAFT_378136 [Podospora australis]